MSEKRKPATFAYILGQLCGAAGVLVCLSQVPRQNLAGLGIMLLIAAWMLSVIQAESPCPIKKRFSEKKGDCHSPQAKALRVIVATELSKNVRWWGFSQWYKWRWHGTHIDLGPVSIYELKQIWFWKTVAFLIFPLRWYYSNFRADVPVDEARDSGEGDRWMT